MPNLMTKRENSVIHAIHDVVTDHVGTYNADLGLALSMIAQAMKTDDPDAHYGCARSAIAFLIRGNFLLKEKTVPMPVLEE